MAELLKIILGGLFCVITGQFLVKFFIFFRKRAVVLKDDPIFLKKEDPLLDEKISYILQCFWEKRFITKGTYLVPEKLRKALKKERFSPEILQELADSIVAHTGAYNVVEVFVQDSVWGNDISGFYQVPNKGNWQVHLFKDTSYSVAQIIAVLIHECVHNFLYYYNLEIYPEEENEILTDVTAVFLGFGELLLQGYRPIKKIAGRYLQNEKLNFKVDSWKVGYLNLNEIAYVQKRYLEYQKRYTQEDVLYGQKLI